MLRHTHQHTHSHRPTVFSLQNFSTSEMKRQCPDSECLFAFYGGETVYHKYLIGLQFYNVFLFFWCANFVTALGQMTLAGAFASYYWAFVKPDDMPTCPIFSSLGRALRCVVVAWALQFQEMVIFLFLLKLKMASPNACILSTTRRYLQ